MKNGFSKIEIPKILLFFLKSLLLLGGAWLIFISIGDATMSVLQHTEHLSILNFDFLLSVFISLLAESILGVLLISFVLIEKGKLMDVIWLVSGVTYSVYTLYSMYEYLRFNLGFFRNITFSFDFLLNVCEFLLYISFLVSIALICYYNKGLLNERLNKLVPLFSIIGLFYLFSVVIISLFNYGEMIVSPIFESVAKLISIVLLYAFSIFDNKGKISFKNVSKTNVDSQSLGEDKNENDLFVDNLYQNDPLVESCKKSDAVVSTEEFDNAFFSVDDILNQIIGEKSKTMDNQNKGDRLDVLDRDYESSKDNLDETLNKFKESIDNYE